MDNSKPDIYVPVFGVNGPLWSLRYEAWFYILYPAFWWIAKQSIAMGAGTMVALFALSHFPAIWPVTLLRDIFSAMLIWWLGALLAEIYVGRLRIPWSAVAWLSLMIVPAIAFPQSFVRLDAVRMLLWGLTFSGLIGTGFMLQERANGRCVCWRI